LSNARNLVSRGGCGGGRGGSTASISSSRVISSGFCGGGDAIDSGTLGTIALPLGASSRLSSSAASSSIVISSGLSARGGGPDLDDDGDVVAVVSSSGSCRTRASNRVCKCAANHHLGWRLRRRPISGGDPSCFEVISPRRNGLRRSRPLRSPCCSIPHGQS
jgi:hypothetical protein